MDRQLATGTTNPANAFARGTIPGAERVLCLNEADGMRRHPAYFGVLAEAVFE